MVALSGSLTDNSVGLLLNCKRDVTDASIHVLLAGCSRKNGQHHLQVNDRRGELS